MSGSFDESVLGVLFIFTARKWTVLAARKWVLGVFREKHHKIHEKKRMESFKSRKNLISFSHSAEAVIKFCNWVFPQMTLNLPQFPRFSSFAWFVVNASWNESLMEIDFPCLTINQFVYLWCWRVMKIIHLLPVTSIDFLETTATGCHFEFQKFALTSEMILKAFQRKLNKKWGFPRKARHLCLGVF